MTSSLFSALLLAGSLLPAGSWLAHSRPAAPSPLSRPCARRERCAFAPRLDEAKKSLDDLIAELRATTPDELPKILADNLKSIDQRLFLRLAEMSDDETDDYEKLRIRQLATLVASTLETILEQADRQMNADAELTQALLGKLALESGEFELPIAPAQQDACRQAIKNNLAQLDEGFVGTVKAYMKKASDDGLESMVDVLRVLLQLFAAERLRSLASAGAVEAGDGVQSALGAVLDAEPTQWDAVLRTKLASDEATCSAAELTDMLQDKMGEVVLGMPAGSAVQSVIAEYLSELLNCARAVAAAEAE